VEKDFVWYVYILEKLAKSRISPYEIMDVFRTVSSDAPVTWATKQFHFGWGGPFPEEHIEQRVYDRLDPRIRCSASRKMDNRAEKSEWQIL
jgi:hypothetical protein